MHIKNLFRGFVLLLIAAPCVLMSCSDKVGNPVGPPNGAVLRGTVRDSVSGAPIPGATIALFSYADTVLRDSVSTNASGGYSLDTIAPGLYWITITSKGFNLYVDTIRFSSGSNILLNRSLGREPQSAYFTITIQSFTSSPMDTAYVLIDGDTLVRAYSNFGSLGGFSFDVQYGMHRLVVAAPGFQTLDTSLTINYTPYNFLASLHPYVPPHFDTLLAEYTFNGSAIDSSGNGHHGTLHGGTFVYDRFGNTSSALQFNGTTDYISVPNSSDLAFGNSKSLTLSFWVKCYAQNPMTDTHYVLHKADTSQGAFTGFSVTNTQYSFYTTVASTASSFVTAPAFGGSNNQWHFIVFTYDGNGTFSSYFDDAEFGFENDSPVSRALRGMMIDTAPMLIGGDGTANHAFSGILDDIRIYRGWLMASQVDSLYHLNGWK